MTGGRNRDRPGIGGTAERVVDQIRQRAEQILGSAIHFEICVDGDAKLPAGAIHGYDPARVEIPAGKRLTLAVTRHSAPNCGAEVIFPKLGIRDVLPPGETILIELATALRLRGWRSERELKSCRSGYLPPIRFPNRWRRAGARAWPRLSSAARRFCAGQRGGSQSRATPTNWVPGSRTVTGMCIGPRRRSRNSFRERASFGTWSTATLGFARK